MNPYHIISYSGLYLLTGVIIVAIIYRTLELKNYKPMPTAGTNIVYVLVWPVVLAMIFLGVLIEGSARILSGNWTGV